MDAFPATPPPRSGKGGKKSLAVFIRAKFTTSPGDSQPVFFLSRTTFYVISPADPFERKLLLSDTSQRAASRNGFNIAGDSNNVETRRERPFLLCFGTTF